MYCAPFNFPFGDKALLHYKGIFTKSNAGSLKLSYDSKSKIFRLEQNHVLHSFDYFMNGGIKLKFSFKLKTSFQSKALVVKSNLPQNTDFPKNYSKKERKPFPVPIVELRRAARARFKKIKKGAPRKPVPPPRRGLLVQSYIPLAYDLFHARIMLINNVNKLLKVVPVLACRWCNELHVGSIGHPFRSCHGTHAGRRNSLHEWTNATLDDVLIPMEAYHLHDRLMPQIPHHLRFSIPRIPALVELCIQAGVDLPEFPAKRRRKPIIRISKSEFIDADESELPDPIPNPNPDPNLKEIAFGKIPPPANASERVLVAEETVGLWGKVRNGAKTLMSVYHVRVCGYCPEVHVGSSGHRAQNCGAFKHQQRNGQHGWQAAVVDDLIPPRFVWHVPDGGELVRELRRFYGKAPAVVEMCAQAGARVPEEYKGTMRLDVGIPKDEVEAELVA